jgi:hypothetical protein
MYSNIMHRRIRRRALRELKQNLNVGNMPPARAKEYLKELSESDTLKVGQNYYVARSSSGKFTEIRYLDDVK